MKRIFLFLVTNVAVLFVLAVLVNIVCAFLGIDLSREIQGNRDFYVQLLLGRLRSAWSGRSYRFS